MSKRIFMSELYFNYMEHLDAACVLRHHRFFKIKRPRLLLWGLWKAQVTLHQCRCFNHVQLWLFKIPVKFYHKKMLLPQKFICSTQQHTFFKISLYQRFETTKEFELWRTLFSKLCHELQKRKVIREIST